MFKKLFFFILFCLLISFGNAQEIAKLKYHGGGDWYANPTALKNLVTFCNTNIHTKLLKETPSVEINSTDLFNYPIVFMTGHGNVFFTAEDVENLRTYLISGGFLHVSDNYGIDKYIRRELKKVFPKESFQEIPYKHPIYHQTFQFENGVPKIHEHDGKKPQGFGIFYKGRLVCYYDYESDLNDGWEDQEVHNDTQEIRTKALKMGANIIEYVFSN